MQDDHNRALSDRRRMLRELIAYFGLVFAITWSPAIFYFFDRAQFEAVVGSTSDPGHTWIFYVAVFAPTICATVLSFAFRGLAGLRALYARLIRPVSPIWVIAAFLIQPAGVFLFGLAEHAAGHTGWVDMRVLTIGVPTMLVTTPAFFLDEGAWGEETGWRGFALPRLLQLMPPAAAGALLGAIWATWHLPAFFVSGLSQSHFAFPLFLMQDVGFSVFMTWLYLRSGGNLLVSGIIPHRVGNLMAYVIGFHVIVTGIVMGALGALLIAAFGPSLTGWRTKAKLPVRDQLALYSSAPIGSVHGEHGA